MKKRAPQKRFRDDGRTSFSYADDIVVACPKCSAAARVTLSDAAAAGRFEPRRLTCTACTHRGTLRVNAISLGRFAGGTARDPYFGLPLRLQTPTRHGVLFAYNGDHLAWIEAYVAAPLRERRIDSGRANRSIVSRLPQWVKSAKNREDVLRAVARLRRSLVG